MRSEISSYREIRDSGDPWIGIIPEHWELVPLGAIGLFSRGSGGTKEDDAPEGVPCIRYGDLYTKYEQFITAPTAYVTHERSADYTQIRQGDLLMAGSGETIEEIGKSAVNLLDGEAVCGGDVVILRPVTEINPRFLGYAADSPAAIRQKARMGRGITVMHVYPDELKHLRIALPPLDEQALIVRFLDHADRRIRRAIRAKQKLIALLNEQKQAVTHRAVVRGLDPNVRLKPSGVDWLGDVPEHWEVKRLKWVTRLQRGYDLPAEARTPGRFAVVSSGGVIDSHCEARAKGPGVVMGRYGSTNAVFFVEDDYWPHNTSLFVTDFQGNDRRWCYFMLKSISKADHAGKSAVPGVDRKDLFEINVVVPPVHEQRDAVAWIERRTCELDAAIGGAQRQIELLREYRTRLIADVVTGKLDVREAAARLADERDDSVPLVETEVDETIEDDVEYLEPVEA